MKYQDKNTQLVDQFFEKNNVFTSQMFGFSLPLDLSHADISNVIDATLEQIQLDFEHISVRVEHLKSFDFEDRNGISLSSLERELEELTEAIDVVRMIESKEEYQILLHELVSGFYENLVTSEKEHSEA
jgi:hypothetical protein